MLIEMLAAFTRGLPDVRGKATVGWRIMDRLERRGRLTGQWSVSLRDGTRYVLPRQSLMAWILAFHGSYDVPARELVSSYIERGTLVLDVGASLGLWTVDLGRRAEACGAKVWAIEPHPNNHRWLRGNVAINDLESTVVIHETALGDAMGSVVMDIGEAGAAGGGGNAAVAISERPGAGVTVPVVTLDSIPRSARVSVIKLDVEGYEIRVLRGAAKLIATDRPVIFGEFTKAWLEARGDDGLVALLDELRDAGYDAFAVAHRRTRPWRTATATSLELLPRGRAPDEDLLLVPTGRLPRSGGSAGVPSHATA